MVCLSALVVLASALATFASPFAERTVAQLEADVATISADVSGLSTAINNFPNSGGTVAEAEAIHTQAATLESSLNQGVTDAQNTGAVDESDATTIVQDIQALEPKIIAALNSLVTKKAALGALPGGGVTALVLQDLKALNGSTVAFEEALLPTTPANLIPNATAIGGAINAAYANAIAAYTDA